MGLFQFFPPTEIHLKSMNGCRDRSIGTCNCTRFGLVSRMGEELKIDPFHG
ncbi:hypothetical protein HanPI659440_Chr03g0102851 [Helianthus annuus]|nr:hypothetical protein HanHA300_Chr03g0080871 [Helianthus annuus]KAJ0767128.1 hypothetical protein HanLR1_Chr03g0085541 [Helianthus annuus]KAJ0800420.1 hypothetical protein HanPI659440_Chr03g0102851 [Helianthus annuus]